MYLQTRETQRFQARGPKGSRQGRHHHRWGPYRVVQVLGCGVEVRFGCGSARPVIKHHAPLTSGGKFKRDRVLPSPLGQNRLHSNVVHQCGASYLGVWEGPEECEYVFCSGFACSSESFELLQSSATGSYGPEMTLCNSVVPSPLSGAVGGDDVPVEPPGHVDNGEAWVSQQVHDCFLFRCCDGGLGRGCLSAGSYPPSTAGQRVVGLLGCRAGHDGQSSGAESHTVRDQPSRGHTGILHPPANAQRAGLSPHETGGF